MLPGVAAAAQDTLVDTLMYKGPTANRVNIVFVADGFRMEEYEQFSTAMLRKTREMFLVIPLYKRYSTAFNVFSLFVPSAESGIDDPTRGIEKDTYFDATFRTDGKRVTADRGKVFRFLGRHLPEYSVIIMVVNAPDFKATGGSVIFINHQEPLNTIVHEIAHQFAHLKDEYGGSDPRVYNGGYNVCRKVPREEIPWVAWIEEDTPIPTPELYAYIKVIGMFEGALYHDKGYYRPKLRCKMRTTSYPFCEVCVEAHVKRIYEEISAVDYFFPDTGGSIPVSRTATGFRISPVVPTLPSRSIEWFADGSFLRDVHGDTLVDIDESVFSGQRNTHSLMAVLADTTSWVRTGPLGMMADTIRWTITTDAVRLAGTGDPTLATGAYIRATTSGLSRIAIHGNRRHAPGETVYDFQGRRLRGRGYKAAGMRVFTMDQEQP
jgi:hypothetical protein